MNLAQATNMTIVFDISLRTVQKKKKKKIPTEKYSIQIIIIILWLVMRIDLLHYFNDHDCDSLMQIKKSALKFCIILLYNSTHYLLNTLKLSCMNTERKFEVKLINQTSSLPVKFDSNFTDN